MCPLILKVSLIILFSSFPAKWSSNEEVTKEKASKVAQITSGVPQKPVWTPANGTESPSLDRRKLQDYKPVSFDSNSLKRSELKQQIIQVRLIKNSFLR